MDHDFGRAEAAKFTASGALFSDCRTWRYALWRNWGIAPPLVAVCLNPSTADETKDDPTVAGLTRRAKAMGCGGIVVLNLFAFRATDPAEMKAAHNPIGPANNESLRIWTRLDGPILFAWGNHGSHLSRSHWVRHLLCDRRAYYLKMNNTGEPQHPLYVSGKVEMKPIPPLPGCVDPWRS